MNGKNTPPKVPLLTKTPRSHAAWAAFICLTVSLFTPLSVRADDYKLVWADEFDVDGPPNPKNWIFEERFRRNHELQWYQSQNAFCKGGNLVIEARRERRSNPNYEEGSKDWRKSRKEIEYTSACVLTRGLHSWLYGRFEVRARIKTEAGLWPAIWFLGNEGKWPGNGEIDLMEFYNGHILANACWGGASGKAKWDSSYTPVASFQKADWDAGYHVWRMDWDRDAIKLYVDDRLLNEISVSVARNPDHFGPQYPFRQPQYLLLNLAIGGDNGGDPSKTTFPSRYEIDYVRVYQK